MQCLFSILERDDAVLIPDDGEAHDDFRLVEVELQDGITTADIDTDAVVLLESPDGDKLRFERGTPETWSTDYDRWEAAGWMPIGFEMVRFYKTYAAYTETLEQ